MLHYSTEPSASPRPAEPARWRLRVGRARGAVAGPRECRRVCRAAHWTVGGWAGVAIIM